MDRAIGFGHVLLVLMGRKGTSQRKCSGQVDATKYITRIAVRRLAVRVSAVVIECEDRSTPPYRIVNTFRNRWIAFRQNRVQ